MPRKQGERKRDHERRIQGWFDTRDEDHRYVLAVVDHLWETEGMTQQEIIRQGIYALANSREDIPIQMPENVSLMQRQIRSLMRMVTELLNLVKSGGFTLGNSSGQTAARLEEELTEIERSVASGYRSFKPRERKETE